MDSASKPCAINSNPLRSETKFQNDIEIAEGVPPAIAVEVSCGSEFRVYCICGSRGQAFGFGF